MKHPINIAYASDDLALAIAAGKIVSEYDDPDPELLHQGIEEEEEEEEEIDIEDEDPDADPDEDDRGDKVDPDLPDLEDDPDHEEEDPDADLDPDALAEIAGGGKSKMVPHARFNEVNETLKAERAERLRLEEELARARGQVPQKKEEAPKEKAYDFDEAEDRYNSAILEGDTEAAKAIRREIRQKEREDFERAAEARAAQAYDQRRAQDDQQRAQQAMAAVATEAYKTYPFLNSEGAEADADAIDMVVALRDRNIAKGMDPAEALRSAVAKVGPMFSDEPPPKDPKETDRSTRQAVIERNLKRDKQIPPRDQGAGERARVVDYANLSEDEFDALPEAEKRKARGDFLG
ncbi:hypothetical protein I5F71_02830 [Pseudomonas aeruginosa]|nr:hypothetical protein [Pseudomonas aeruginosa]MBG4718182.1 hypothetical protein [Pseudomonas aeruginosa]